MVFKIQKLQKIGGQFKENGTIGFKSFDPIDHVKDANYFENFSVDINKTKLRPFELLD